jgi:hypothetical protein
MQVAFQPLVEGAKRAKAAIEAEGQKAGRAIGTSSKKGSKDAEKAFAELANSVKTGMPRAMNAGSAAVVKFSNEAKSSFAKTKAAFADMAKDAERQLGKIAKAEAVAAKKKPTNLGSIVRSMGSGTWAAAGGGGSNAKDGVSYAGALAAGAAKKAASLAYGIAKDIARASGVDTDIGSIAKKNFDLETSAQNVSNQGFIGNDPRNNRRVSKEALVTQALDVGSRTGTDANALIEGLDKFTSKTGDLRTGRDIMEQMSTYAKATGASVEDFMDAAGDIANQLGNVENKGKAVSDLMRSFAGQGKLGAVEIKNMATQMAKIGAASLRFEGDKSGAITQMGAMAQMARARGGAFSAANAATSVGAFAGVFSKGARLSAFEKLGVNVQGAGDKVKSPKQILVESMLAAEKHAKTSGKGGLGTQFDKTMGTMFSDVSSRKSTLGFESIFKEKGGGAAGAAAVTAEFERLENAIIADEEIAASFAAAMRTSTSQAEVFNNEIRKSAMQMQTALAPAMASLYKALVPLAGKAASVVTWLTGGPKEGEAMTADASAAVKETVTSLEKQMKGGKVSDPSIQRGKEEAKQASFAVNRAKAELQMSKETLADAGKGKEYSWWNVIGKSGGAAWDLATDVKGQAQEDVAKKEQTLKDAQAAYDKMTATNQSIKDQLTSGKLTVVIDNVDQLKAALAPPAAGSDGRQPPPEVAPR